jgi:alpha-glucosidase (family GH31 glycosyl hydrolase)
VYPDYLAASNIQMWIKAQLQRFFDQVPFDGLWLDMNEASNFCSGNKCKAPEDPAKLKGEGEGGGRARGVGLSNSGQHIEC